MQASVEAKFYPCVPQTFDEAMNACDRPVYDWLTALQAASPRPSWTPQEVARAEIAQRTNEAISSNYAQCLLRGRQPEQAPEPGLTVRIQTKMSGGSGSGGSGAPGGMAARLSLNFGPLGGLCGGVAYHVANDASVAHSVLYYNFVTVPASGYTEPVRNGVPPHYDGTYVIEADWRPRLHQGFRLAFVVEGDNTLAYAVNTGAITSPPMPTSLAARVESFDPARIHIENTGAPSLPRWEMLHRFTHDSGRRFFFGYWVDATSDPWQQQSPTTFGLTSPVANLNGFTVPFDDLLDDPFFNPEGFDPDGVWLHEAGMRNIDIGRFDGSIHYDGGEWARFWSTTGLMTDSGVFDPEIPPWLGQVFSEYVVVHTFGQHKAAVRIVGVETLPGIGLLIRFKLRNEFHYPACICTTIPLSNNLTPAFYFAANLAPGAEGAEKTVIVPVAQITPGAYEFKSQNYPGTNGPAEFNALPDGVYRTTALPSLIKATGSDALTAAIINPEGRKVSAFDDVVFGYTLAHAAVADGEKWGIRAVVSGEYLSVDGNWYPFEEGFSRYLSPAEARERYGRVVSALTSSVRMLFDWNMVAFTAWGDGDAAAALEQHLIDTHPYQTDPAKRNLVFVVTKRPHIVASLWMLVAQDDYPGVYPDSLPDFLGTHVVIRGSGQTGDRIDILLGTSS